MDQEEKEQDLRRKIARQTFEAENEGAAQAPLKDTEDEALRDENGACDGAPAEQFISTTEEAL